MLKKTISFTDYNGVERTEEHRFNLNEAEILEMELTTPDGMGIQKYLEHISNTKDGAAIVKFFRDLITKSYGVKSEDGRRFIKSEKLSTEFAQTEAYSKLFMELVSDAEAAAAFTNGVVSVNKA